jgi:hypothetical protein
MFLLFVNFVRQWSSDDYHGRFQVNGKSRQMFNIIVSTKSVFLSSGYHRVRKICVFKFRVFLGVEGGTA